MSVLGLRKTGGRGRHAARRAAPLTTLPALVLHTVRFQARGVLIWGAALGLYSAALVASFTTFSGSAEQMNQLLEAYPKGMLEAFGITDLADVENYMNSQVFLLAPLALAFFPILAAAVLFGARSTSMRMAVTWVRAPTMASIASSERAMEMKLPTTSCQRGIGFPSRTSMVPRSSAPAIVPADVSMGKNASASGASRNTWELM